MKHSFNALFRIALANLLSECGNIEIPPTYIELFSSLNRKNK